MTTDHERQRRADDLAELATRIAVALTTLDGQGRTVVNRMREAMAGQPRAQSLEGDRTTGFTTTVDEDGFPVPAVSDPTGEAGIRIDHAHRSLVDLDRQLRAAHMAADRIVRILDTFTPRPATSYEQRQLRMDNEPGCWSCAHVEVVRGVPRWEPVWRTGNPGGVLAEPRALCHWCWRFAVDFGRLPTKTELDSHHAGKRLKRTP